MVSSRTIGIAVAAVAVVGIGAYAVSQNGGSTKKSDAYNVALVTDGGGIDDKSFNQSAWEGLEAYGKANDLKKGVDGYNYFQSTSASDIKTNLQQAVKAGYKLVYGVGFATENGIKEVSKANPKTNFAIIDDVVSAKNVESLTFQSEQSSYLAGVAAAKTTKTDKVGFVGGIHGDVIDTFEAGFKAGVKSVNPKIQVITQYADSFTDAAKGKTIAAAIYANGADVIFQAAGGTGNGVFTEAKALNQKTAAADKVWVIGVDRDQNADGAYTDKDGKTSNFTLASALKRVDVAVEKVANDAKDGKFKGGKIEVFGLKDKGVDLTTNNLSDDAKAAVESARKAILAGDVKVPVHP
ncbi:MAG TPA: BMP family ABC transporter substrate-binding protein [Lactobacillaceae bacterium]|jgi:basic membrane protein A